MKDKQDPIKKEKKSKEIYTVEKYRLTHPLKIKTNKTFLAMTRNQQQK